MRTLLAILILSMSALAIGQTILGQATVIDGDTIEIGSESVRLFGIDAPEAKQTCQRGGEDWACGQEATRRLKELIDGNSVQCKTRARDQYGRLIASCTVGRFDVARQMIDSGLATVPDDGPHEYLEAQSRVSSFKVGIWDSDFIAPSEWRDANPHELPAPVMRAPEPEQSVRLPIRRASNGQGQCLIKGNRNSRGEWIYHLPGRPYYEQTNAEEWFCSEAQAQAAGYRRSRAR